jgi:hypothetical protein
VTPLVLVILAMMWVLVLVPPLLRSRSDGRPSASVHSFRRQLSTLGRAAPMSVARVPRAYGRPAGAYRPAPQRSPGYGYASPRGYGQGYGGFGRMSQRAMAKRRRQNVLLTLVGAAFFSGVIAYGVGVHVFVWVNLGTIAALLGYVYLLVSMRKAEEERAYARSWYEAA